MNTEAADIQVADDIGDNSPHKIFIRSLSHVERDRLGAIAGVSGAYITTLVYRKASTCSLPIAVAIDQFSKGKYDFRELVQQDRSVDWNYVRNKLNESPTA